MTRKYEGEVWNKYFKDHEITSCCGTHNLALSSTSCWYLIARSNHFGCKTSSWTSTYEKWHTVAILIVQVSSRVSAGVVESFTDHPSSHMEKRCFGNTVCGLLLTVRLILLSFSCCEPIDNIWHCINKKPLVYNVWTALSSQMKSLMQFINWENASLSITKKQPLTLLGLVHKNGRKFCRYLLMLFQTCKFQKGCIG